MVASETALNDPFPELRLQGSLYFQDAEELAAIVKDETVDDGLRVHGLRRLVKEEPRQLALSVVERLLRSKKSKVVRAAVEAVSILKPEKAVALLQDLIPTAADETAVAIAEALSRIEHPAREEALQRDEAEIRLSAVQALEQVGTITAVEPLLPFARTLSSSKLSRAARKAVDAIQARLGEREAGRLAVAEAHPQQGELSMAGEPGRLSLEQEPPGRHRASEGKPRSEPETR
jgi:HEAT repeat protein